MCESIQSQPEEVPVIDFGESQKLQELMDPPADKDESPGIVEVIPESQVPEEFIFKKPLHKTSSTETLPAEPCSSEYDPWEEDEDWQNEAGPSRLTVENRMYRKLLIKQSGEYLLQRSAEQPQVERLEVYESDRFDLKDSWKTGLSAKEDLFLLRNALIKVGGKYREGHGMLQMVYFPHKTDRMIEAEAADKAQAERLAVQQSTDSLVLSEHEMDTQPRGIGPRYNREDFVESMNEMAFEYERTQRRRQATHEPEPSQVQVETDPDGDSEMTDTEDEEPDDREGKPDTQVGGDDEDDISSTLHQSPQNTQHVP
ncbi:hypothetical protein FKP32DRAFT_1674097 [Trametes sanguinea]|nr:hypothetical protein FKP32DRAFT_1674097 [Trametes sanguinea]